MPKLGLSHYVWTGVDYRAVPGGVSTRYLKGSALRMGRYSGEGEGSRVLDLYPDTPSVSIGFKNVA